MDYKKTNFCLETNRLYRDIKTRKQDLWYQFAHRTDTDINDIILADEKINRKYQELDQALKTYMANSGN